MLVETWGGGGEQAENLLQTLVKVYSPLEYPVFSELEPSFQVTSNSPQEILCGGASRLKVGHSAGVDLEK